MTSVATNEGTTDRRRVVRVVRGVLLALAALVAVCLLWVAIGLTARTGTDAERHEQPPLGGATTTP